MISIMTQMLQNQDGLQPLRADPAALGYFSNKVQEISALGGSEEHKARPAKKRDLFCPF
jgi:hypothetical protein